MISGRGSFVFAAAAVVACFCDANRAPQVIFSDQATKLWCRHQRVRPTTSRTPSLA